MTILQGDDEDRLEQVFGGNVDMLHKFLEAAEERDRNGIVEGPQWQRQQRVDEEKTETYGVLSPQKQPGYELDYCNEENPASSIELY